MGADAEGGPAYRRPHTLQARGPSLQRQADRAGQELRRPGRHRYRKYATVDRAAQITGAADGDIGVLQVISKSPGDLQPVFAAMLENAVRICQANFGNMYLWNGQTFDLAANFNTPPSLVEYRKRFRSVRRLKIVSVACWRPRRSFR